MADDLLAFLNARLDEDERIARAVTPDDWGVGDESSHYEWEDLPDAAFAHAKRHDPARVLREVEAGRQLLSDYEEARTSEAEAAAVITEILFMQIINRVRVYGDHPDCRQEWRP